MRQKIKSNETTVCRTVHTMHNFLKKWLLEVRKVGKVGRKERRRKKMEEGNEYKPALLDYDHPTYTRFILATGNHQLEIREIGRAHV